MRRLAYRWPISVVLGFCSILVMKSCGSISGVALSRWNSWLSSVDWKKLSGAFLTPHEVSLGHERVQISFFGAIIVVKASMKDKPFLLTKTYSNNRYAQGPGWGFPVRLWLGGRWKYSGREDTAYAEDSSLLPKYWTPASRLCLQIEECFKITLWYGNLMLVPSDLREYSKCT